MKVFLGANKEIIEIENQPSLGRGGEGEVYRVIAPSKYVGYCVKLYNASKITEEKIKKLEYLLRYSPITDSKGHRSVIWIEGIIYVKAKNSQNYTFAGLLMPIAEGYSVEYLCVSKFPVNRIKSNELALYKKFDRTHPDSFKSRLAVCYNIAIAVAQLHQSGLYVHADIKPENIIFNAKGKVSIIDFDTVQVTENKKVIFSALACTPEYVPPMYQQSSLRNTVFIPFTDVFSISVIFYRILTGIHPFASANFKAPYDNVTDIPTAIQHKLFPFGAKANYFNQVPPPHQLFKKIPENLRNLFIEVLENQNTSVKATDWIETIHPQKSKLHFPEIPVPKPAPISNYETVFTHQFQPNPVIVLPTYIDNQYDKLKWADEKDLKPSFMDILFKNSKARTANEIIYLQNACKMLIQEYKALKKKHSDMLLKYATQSKAIAEKAQENYLNVVYSYKSSLSDTSSEQLYYQFIEQAYKQLEQWLEEKSKQIPKVKELLDSYFKELEKLKTNELQLNSQHIHAIRNYMHTNNLSFEQAKEEYIQELRNIYQNKITPIEQEIQQSAKKVPVKNWEDHPWIQEQCAQTYIKDAELSTVTINQFIRAGFITAADIIDIDDKGQILNSKGQFVKIPQIGFTRANEVWNWKNEVLKNLKRKAKKQNIDLTSYDTPEIIDKKAEVDNLKTELNQLEFYIKNFRFDLDNPIQELSAHFWYRIFKITNTTLEEVIKPSLRKYQKELEKCNPEQVIAQLKNMIDAHNEKQLEIRLYYENTHLDYTKQKTEIENKMQENITRIKELWKNL